MSDPDRPKEGPSGTMRAAGVGMELAATVIGCCLAGYWIDSKLATSPWGILILAFVGISGGIYNLVRRDLRRTLRQSADKKKGLEKTGRADKE